MTSPKRSNVKEFSSMEEAFKAAAEAAGTNFGRPIFGILYKQAGRTFISTSLPTKILLSLAQLDSTKRKGDDPGQHRNRPLDRGHVKEISQYLQNGGEYLIPPIMLNSADDLQVFVYESAGVTKPCIAILPSDQSLYVTDGQHRLEALREAILRDPQLEKDSIGVTIIEEKDIDKVHQDFYDAAQAMALAKAILVEYDGRAPLNWLTKELIAGAKIFDGRVERVGNVGKNSLMLFTTNQVKQALLQLIVGDWSIYAKAMTQQADQAVKPAQDLWLSRLVRFFDAFTSANPQWREVSERPLETGMRTDIPGMREHYLHFTGAGLLVLSGVGHSIVSQEPMIEGEPSPEASDLIQRLAHLDWSRGGPLWRGYLVGTQGNVSPHKNNVVLAVAKAKQAIGVELTPKELGAIDRTEFAIPAVIS